MAQSVNTHGKVKSNWRPLGFFHYFYQSGLPSSSKIFHHNKQGSESIKSSNILPNAIITYFDTKLETQIAIYILFCKDTLEGKHEDSYSCYCPSPLFLCISNFWWVWKIHKSKTGQTNTSSTFNVTDQFQPIILQSASKNVSQARPYKSKVYLK